MLASCASLYRELIKAGITPLDADEMELWQIASLMSQDDESSTSSAPSPSPSPTSSPSQSDALLRERVRRRKAGLAPISEDELEAYDASSVRQISTLLAAGG